MGQKGMDFKHKEVINIKDGKRLGFVQDVVADLESGTITSIMVARKILIMKQMFMFANSFFLYFIIVYVH